MEIKKIYDNDHPEADLDIAFVLYAPGS